MEPIGKATFVGDDDILYYDAESFLDCIRAELPYRDTTGFRYEVLTDDPAIRKAADERLRAWIVFLRVKHTEDLMRGFMYQSEIQPSHRSRICEVLIHIAILPFK